MTALICRAMGGRLVPIIDPDLIVLITNSNVKHELSSSQYPIRRQQCEEAAKIIGVDKLRDVSLNQLLGQDFISLHVMESLLNHCILMNIQVKQCCS